MRGECPAADVENGHAPARGGHEFLCFFRRVGGVVTLPDFVVHALCQRGDERIQFAVHSPDADAFLLPQDGNGGDRQRGQQRDGVHQRQPDAYRDALAHDAGAIN